jgi:hypothetical protein
MRRPRNGYDVALRRLKTIFGTGLLNFIQYMNHDTDVVRAILALEKSTVRWNSYLPMADLLTLIYRPTNYSRIIILPHLAQEHLPQHGSRNNFVISRNQRTDSPKIHIWGRGSPFTGVTLVTPFPAAPRTGAKRTYSLYWDWRTLDSSIERARHGRDVCSRWASNICKVADRYYPNRRPVGFFQLNTLPVCGIY